jgi:hypothetical protein
VERLGDLREQGVIDVAEESRLLQHYDALQRDIEDEKARLEPEYVRRITDDGRDVADAWLAEAAHDMGRRHGEATRALTERLRVVTG